MEFGKAGEVVVLHENFRSLVHEVEVGVEVYAAVEPLQEGQPAVADAVLVGPCRGIETCVGVVLYGEDVVDGYVGRQEAVELEDQIAGVGVVGEVAVGVEVGGVDSGVGPAAPYDGDGLAQQGAKCLLEGELHGGQVGLGLPSAVVGAVVC